MKKNLDITNPFSSPLALHSWPQLGFFSGYSGFPLSPKTNTSKFQFDTEKRAVALTCFVGKYYKTAQFKLESDERMSGSGPPHLRYLFTRSRTNGIKANWFLKGQTSDNNCETRNRVRVYSFQTTKNEQFILKKITTHYWWKGPLLPFWMQLFSDLRCPHKQAIIMCFTRIKCS